MDLRITTASAPCTQTLIDHVDEQIDRSTARSATATTSSTCGAAALAIRPSCDELAGQPLERRAAARSA